MIGAESCMNDSDNSASATQDFFALYDSIVFDDSADVVFMSAIDTALQTLGVVTDSYLPQALFTETAEVNVSSSDYAVQKCVEQAEKTYEKKLAEVTREKILNRIKYLDLNLDVPVDSLDGFAVYYDLMYYYRNVRQPISIDQYPRKY